MTDTLPFGDTHARATDPDTSKAAAHAAEESAKHQKAAILGILATRVGGATAYEIAKALRMKLSTHEVGKRLPDLERDGLAYPTDDERESAESGRMQRVWLMGSDPAPRRKKPTLTQQVAALRECIEEQGRKIAALEAERKAN